MSKKHKIAEIRKLILEVHGRTIRLSSNTFTGMNNKHAFECRKCEHVWEVKPSNVITLGSGCPVCSKTKQANNIALGHANSARRESKYWARIERLEKLFDIAFLDKVVPERHSAKGSFTCNKCDYEWSVSILRLEATDYGCPNCAKQMRLINSNTKEYREQRSKLFSKTTKEARKYFWKSTCGRTTLISKWQGQNKSRRFSCNLCQHEWDVKERGIERGKLCPRCTNRGAYSSIALTWLRYEARRRRIKIRHAKNGGEYRLPGTRMKVDGFHARSNTVFEFHGDAFHGNPKVYAPTSNPHPWNKSRASALYKRTKQRERKIKALGYNLVVMWESDFRELVRKSKV